ncbi:prolyl 4-hydroxylase subunit alpha-1-like [Babylonia areolata]|uniref:prolyl 4-hydroxylase subunit alpha-1-like n=1 Tax=Babylonia areolata TaxID=304850 RepID=UPI003FD43AD0
MMLWVTFWIVLSEALSTCYGEVFTSSYKILDLVNREKTLLDALQNHINAEYDNLKALSSFLSDRSRSVRTTSVEALNEQAEHPNGAYLLIRLYTHDWNHVVTANPLFDRLISNLKPHLPTPDDYRGACSAIIRLQRVYRLRVEDMYRGNYSGYMGPALDPTDAFEIGRQSFVDGFLEESRQWLHLAVDHMETQERGLQRHDRHRASPSQRGQMYGLLGRTYFFMNRTEKAREMYEMGRQYDSSSGDVIQLQRELQTGAEGGERYGSAVEDWHRDMEDLCMRDKAHRVARLRPFHTCRYKQGVASLPYVRYKEEILSTSPFTSLIYDFITDTETRVFKDYIKGRMFRGLVGMGINATTSFIRTSNLGWVYDDEIVQANRLSQRVKSVTGLEVAQRTPNGPSSSEAFQIVNYGLGGHYDLHMDPFDDPPDDDLLKSSGERLATFLIYLTDVEKGGNTVFLHSKISVAPQKGMALFWYNYDTKMMKDLDTHHAGCPVLIGHKWIANKWIWTYGNTFRRPCGPFPNSTQEEIEPLMYSRHRLCDVSG